MRRIRSSLTYANVTASLALFIALSGTAWAAANPPRNSVGERQLKPDAVTGAKIKDGTVKGRDLNGDAKPMWAVVRASRWEPHPTCAVCPPHTKYETVLVRGQGVERVVEDAPGRHVIRFTREVAGCIPQVTPLLAGVQYSVRVFDERDERPGSYESDEPELLRPDDVVVRSRSSASAGPSEIGAYYLTLEC